MSEKKSWDIAPRARTTGARSSTASSQAAVPPRPSTTRPRMPVDMVRSRRQTTSRASSPGVHVAVRPQASARTASVRTRTRPIRKEAQPPGRLRERRQKARKHARFIALIVVVLGVAGSLSALWMPQLRVQEVSAQGVNAEAVKDVVRAQLEGTYWAIVPKSSIFFFPKTQMQDAVLAEFPDIAEVTITRASFTSLAVDTTPRTKAFVWCGTSFATPFMNGQCFDADSTGLLFRASNIVGIVSTAETASSSTPAPEEARQGTPTSEELRVYGSLAVGVEEGAWPVGVQVAKAATMPNVLELVNVIKTLNVPIIAITLRDDEADLWVNDVTRITYVIGREQSAATLATSVIPTLTLTDGTIQYLDLRFNGKAYVKRYGE